MVRDALHDPDPHLRKSWLHMLVPEVCLSNDGLVICGRTSDLEVLVARTADMHGAPVPAFARKWRTRHDSNV